MTVRLPTAPSSYDERDQRELRRILETLLSQVADLANGQSSVLVQDEGVNVSGVNTLNFVGSGVTATTAGSVATVTIAGGGGGSIASQDEGVPLGATTTFNFVGAGVTAAGSPTTTVTIPGGAGSPGPTGPSGPPGQDGQEGGETILLLSGLAGSQGAAGTNGTNGRDGIPGQDGQDGGESLIMITAPAQGITQLTGDVTAGPGSGSVVATIPAASVANAKLATMAASGVKGNNSGGGNVSDLTIHQALDLVGTTVGGVMVRSASNWVEVTTPASGLVLTSNGIGADPTWQTPSASGSGAMGPPGSDGQDGGDQIIVIQAPTSAGGGVTVQDEGADLGTATIINFTGAGVTASGAGTIVVNVPGGAGSATVTQATVTLPSPAKYDHRVVVTDAAVSGTSKLMVSLAGVSETSVNTPETAGALVLAGLPAAGSFTFIGTFQQPISGPLDINYMIG